MVAKGDATRKSLLERHPEGNNSAICGSKVYTFVLFDSYMNKYLHVPSAAEIELLRRF